MVIKILKIDEFTDLNLIEEIKFKLENKGFNLVKTKQTGINDFILIYEK